MIQTELFLDYEKGKKNDENILNKKIVISNISSY